MRAAPRGWRVTGWAQTQTGADGGIPMTGDTPTPDTPDSPEAPASPALVRLAEAHGIATEYWSFFGERVKVPATTLRATLRAMGVDATTDATIAAALVTAEDEPWRALLPASTVARTGTGTLVVHVRDGHDVRLSVGLEDGSWRDLAIPDQQPTSHEVDGVRRWRLEIPVPADLPLGWHTVHATESPFGGGEPSRTASAPLVVTPERMPAPPTRPGRHRGWGLMAQLYSVRSHASWGMGDFGDLGDLAALAGERGADFLLVNPVHAAEVTSPIEPSPYLPATRRFLAPLYVRPEDIREVAYLAPAERALVEAARTPVAAGDTDPERIDRDAVWAAKRAALEVIFAAPLSAARRAELAAFAAREGQPLQDFALWCALEEHFAGQQRPVEARDISSPLVVSLREQLADRVAFHVWLQWIADQQLERAQAAATASGMSIGVMHDLAVGVHPQGSDAWSLRDMYAPGIAVGAPPDMYNQQGQTWNQPPWLPAALAEAGYAPLRDMIRTLLRHAGALRIDHVIGLFRLWWIPAGLGPAAGTYVRYDHEAMIGVLMLEAQRAGAVLIGEDLGNVEPWVRDYLSARGILGTSVLWFEREGDGFRPPEQYREALLATVNTHDLPPTAGYLADEHVALRARLGLLTRPVEEELAEADAERATMLALLRERGLIGDSPTEAEVIEALNVFITAAPSRLLGVALVDAVGERRTQNQPGTSTEYPNWQIPLAGPDGRVVLLDDLAQSARFTSLLAAVDARI
ncbi:4-alpha-glucanotransferase [Microbacterium dextranolyticum]|uniref:4-alpha-glucanotransferase n=2 Tax=Microbacterium dextranolyticum TaxID=36806 RepID=A0A9W6M5D5_9MICO|nr:4-alpha-glucanotransferase [Microbacterium dextranolyticum]